MIRVGLPRMHKEPGERRDFLPELVADLVVAGAEVIVEREIGSGMGLRDEDYTALSPAVRAGTLAEAYDAPIVLVLRAPIEHFDLIAPGTTLVAMLHFPTRPARVSDLKARGIDAISLDLVEDDVGRRLVVNAGAVAWNGLEAAFDTLERVWPELGSTDRRPVRATVMGAGEIGKHAVEAATKYGSLARNERLTAAGCPGVEVVTVGRNLTDRTGYLRERLAVTDVLIDATQRYDPSVPLVTNDMLGLMPAHAVVADLVVDPYLLDSDPPVVRAIEGIPQGNLDRYVFAPDDPAWGEVPPSIPSAERRHVVSCYSWPGVHPVPCMELYGLQLSPLLSTLLEQGGAAGLRPDGPFHERALYRASLRGWLERELDALAAG